MSSNQDKLDKLLTNEHRWYNISKVEERCEWCGYYIGPGAGTEDLGACCKRFDDKKFAEFVEFKNYSKLIRKNPKFVDYAKRYSTEIITERQMLLMYLKVNGVPQNRLKEVLKLSIKRS